MKMPAFQRRAPTANSLRCRNWPRNVPGILEGTLEGNAGAPGNSTPDSGAYFRRQGRSGCGDGPIRPNVQLFRGHWVNGLGSPARILLSTSGGSGRPPFPPCSVPPARRRPRGSTRISQPCRKRRNRRRAVFQEGNRFVGSTHGLRPGSCRLLIIYYLNGDPEQQGGSPGVNQVIDGSLASVGKTMEIAAIQMGANF